MTHADIAAVIAKVPGLNAHGIGIFDGYRDRPAAAALLAAGGNQGQ
jgi:hypothetical protein